MSPEPIKVLLVDDSAVVRHLVSAQLARDAGLVMIGVAANGKIALNRMRSLDPDVVVLDVEMPELDGLRTLAEIRKSHPLLPVIMFSSVTNRGAAVTLDALALGANDYVAKPQAANNTSGQIEPVCRELMEKIKAHCKQRKHDPLALAKSVAGQLTRSTAATSPAPVSRHGSQRSEVVVVGVSTGGPNALAEMVPQLPADLPVPMLIAQHMPPIFTRLLAERLAAKSRVPVVEASAGEPLAPGKVWIAPGDYHLTIRECDGMVTIQTDQGPRENSCRPSADVLFRSAAAVFGTRALAVVLTGMGQDGLLGATAIRGKGGQVIVQDEQSSVVWGMPGFVARAGLADKTLPLGEIALEVMRRVRRPAPSLSAAGAKL